MSSVFIPSNGSLVLPPTNRSYSYGMPVRHAAYPVAGSVVPGMGMGMGMGVPTMQPMYGGGGVHTVVPSHSYGGSYVGGSSTVMMPSTQYHHPGMGMPMSGYSGYSYGASPYYGHAGQPTTIIIPSPRKHRRSSSSHHSHRRSRSRDYY